MRNLCLLLTLFICSVTYGQIDNLDCIQKFNTVKKVQIVNKTDLQDHYNALDSMISVCNVEDSIWINAVINKAILLKDTLVKQDFIWSYYVYLYRAERNIDALTLATKLIDYSEQNNLPLSGDYYIEAGLKHIQIEHDYAQSLNLYEKALKAYTRDKSENLVYALANFAQLYQSIEDMDNALIYNEKAYEASLQMEADYIKYYNTSSTLVSIAQIYEFKKENNKANKYYKHAITDALKQNNHNLTLSNYGEYIRFLTEVNKLDSVQKYVSESESFIKLINRSNFKKEDLHLYLLNISKYGIASNNLRYISHPDTILNADLSITAEEDGYKYAITYFTNRNEPIKALNYSQSLNELYQKETDLQRKSTLELLFEKQKSAQLLEENYNLSESTATRKLFNYILSILLVLGVFFLLLGYFSNQKTKKLNADIENKNKKITEQFNELERISYVMTHDLKEPVKTIQSFSNLIDKNHKPDMSTIGQEYFNVIKNTSNGMLKSIETLHNYLLIGRKFELKSVDLQKTLDLAKQNLAATIIEKKAAITNDPLPIIRCEEEQITKLFQTLISNAMKYSKPNILPEIHLSFAETEQSYNFALQDNGIGISQDNIKEIFVLFKRLHTQSDIEGSGIGLANANKIIQMHKGKIWVDSKVNEGSTFYFTITKKWK